MILSTQNTDGLKSLSQIYTRSNFNRVIRKNDLKFTNTRLFKHLKISSNSKYADLLENLYYFLQRTYRSEYFYKNALINKLLLGTYSLNTTTVLNEFKIGSSVADFVLLNGEARIYEIKTDLDNLDKLEKQISDYSQFGNKVYIVASYNHIKKLSEIFADSPIGLIEFTQRDTLSTIKEADSCSGNFDHTCIFKVLRKHEYLEIIQESYGAIPDVPNTLIFRECLRLAKQLDICQFQKMAFEKLKARKLRSPQLLLDSRTPYELKHICYTMDLSTNEYDNLYKFLNKELAHVSSLPQR